MAHDVFVSHSAKDKTVSDALVAKLEAQGIRCWVAPRDVVPGADWGESIIDAIESSRIMVLIFSASANGSPQIKREIERAVDKGVYTIPFRIEDVQPTKALEYFISSAHWLDAFSQPLAQHLESLAKTLKAILATPRPGSTPEMIPSPPVMSPPPPAFTLPAQAPVEKPRTLPPEPSAPPRPKNTMWMPVIVGIIALLAIAGGVVYFLRVSPSPAAKPNEAAIASPSPVSSPPALAKPSPSEPKTTSPAASRTPSLSSPAAASPKVPGDPELKTLVLESLLAFNKAAQQNNFASFHQERLTPEFQREFPLPKFTDPTLFLCDSCELRARSHQPSFPNSVWERTY
ncbi:MAG: TIR domain-containing protein [Verrucomicrobiota bacterium]|nr:TIR domain-containing protein [Verrucomicrobiota bacterium]